MSQKTINDKRLKMLTGKSQQDKNYTSIHQSEYYPGTDELLVREFAKLNENVQIVKGSFIKCKSNGIITNYDIKYQSQIFKNGLLCTFNSTLFSILILLFLKAIDKQPKQTYISNNKVFACLGTITGAMFSYYKYSQEVGELDKKYTAIWLKSIGKL